MTIGRLVLVFVAAGLTAVACSGDGDTSATGTPGDGGNEDAGTSDGNANGGGAGRGGRGTGGSGRSNGGTAGRLTSGGTAGAITGGDAGGASGGSCIPLNQFPKGDAATLDLSTSCTAEAACGGALEGKSFQLESICLDGDSLFGRVTNVCGSATVSGSGNSAEGSISFAGGQAAIEVHGTASASVDFPNSCSFCQCSSFESKLAGVGLIATCSPVCNGGTCTCTVHASVDVSTTASYTASGNLITVGSLSLDYCVGALGLSTHDTSTNGKLGAAKWTTPTALPEKCDGIDNDGNNQVDDDPRDCPPCKTEGVCAQRSATCNGASGWTCEYTSPDYQADETACDGLDNDCDGQVDEPSPEVCNGRDDNCDGSKDENPAADAACVAEKGAGYVCQSGSCVCLNQCGGGCVDIQTDVAHCGGCGKACPTGASCSGGVCSCPQAKPTVCTNVCANLQLDPQNCGTCGKTCALACGNGTCLEVSSLALGDYSTCAVMKDGTARCWGNNWTLGTGSTAPASTPTPVGSLTQLAGVTVGGLAACAWSSSSAQCWGENSFGRLGDGTTADHLTPKPVSNLTSIAGLSAAAQHSCAWTTGGVAYCWGDGSSYQLGTGNGGESSVPVAVSGVTSVIQVTTGLQHTCALTSGGTVYCWGSNISGQLGTGTNGQSPAPVTGISTAVQIGAGSLHTCARLSNKTVQCWGSNTNGPLGDGSNSPHATAMPVPGLSNVEELAVGGEHNCARLTDQTVRCWGWNQNGQVGDGTRTNALSPVPISGLASVQSIAAGGQHTCARLASGVVQCWGANAFGQIGDGTTTAALTPVTVKW